MLTDAEDVQAGVVGDHGEVDELSQPAGWILREAGHGVGGELTEREDADLERASGAVPGHRGCHGARAVDHGSTPTSPAHPRIHVERSSTIAGSIACPPG